MPSVSCVYSETGGMLRIVIRARCCDSSKTSRTAKWDHRTDRQPTHRLHLG